ncbi:hypothetical protein [Bacillus sp. ISL-45]|uniref:hypothetical protein n=1 Tax=Bacillus sp. ISL-45 TaxID=2819128 RepID=UPI001BE70DE4|nr:hypothetical protein [Bacillus sp. ISL-45]MBT2661587.1 hypothetical protein [Bacillus sp. ISL-45]
MKKSFKIAIATVLILLAGTAGVLYYFLNVKEYDVADEKVEEITKTEYKVALPDLDSLVEGTEEGEGDGAENSDGDSGDTAADGSKAASAGTVNDSNSEAASSDTGSGNEAGTSSASNTDASKKDTESKKTSTKVTEGKKKDESAGKEEKADEDAAEEEKTVEKKKPEVTAEMIKAAYRPSFEELQAQANAKIDALVNTAFSEYSAKKESGESISFTYFYRKYTSAGKELEASTDKTFNYIYDSLVSDLTARGFSSSEANEFKTQYENAKAARENALIDKAKSAI